MRSVILPTELVTIQHRAAALSAAAEHIPEAMAEYQRSVLIVVARELAGAVSSGQVRTAHQAAQWLYDRANSARG